MAAAPSQPISIGRLPPPPPHQSLLSANHPSNSNNNGIFNQNSQLGTSPAAYSYLGADLTAQNPRWAGTSASPARNTQELSTSWNIHPGPLFVSSQHAASQASSSSYAQQQQQYHHQGGQPAYASSSSAAGLAGSYTGGGTPMSLSSSFYARFLPHASTSSSPGFSGPGVLNPLDPTDFKFSSSPYGGRAWGSGGYGSYSGARGFSGSYGRGFVGSMESDRMSVIEGFYGGKGEKDACRDFSCCGLRLKDLHALVEHFETNHADQYPDFTSAAAAAASHPGLAMSSSAQQMMNLTHMARGRRVTSTGSGNARRLVNQNSNSSLAGALGEPESAARAPSAQSQQVRTQGSNSNLSSAAGSSGASLTRGRRGGDAEGGAGPAVDDMEIGLDLDMDMDMDVDMDMDHSSHLQSQHPHPSHNASNNGANNGNAAQGSTANSSGSTSSGSGTGSPNLGAGTGAISNLLPGPAMRGAYGLGANSGVNSPLNASRATSPPDTPLLSTPVTPANANGGGPSQAGSGFNSPIFQAQLGGGQDAAGAFRGFGAPSSAMASANGAHVAAAGNGQMWGENAMTPMPMVEVKQEDVTGDGAYFGRQAQEEDNRSVSDGSNSPHPPLSSASTSTSNLHASVAWDDSQNAGPHDGQQQAGRMAQGHHGLMHTQSLYALRGAAQEQLQQNAQQGSQVSAFSNNNSSTDDYDNSVLGVGLGPAGGMGHSGGLVDRAAVQRAREREEALLRSGSGVFNNYARYADWSRGFPGVADAEGVSAALEASGAGPLDGGPRPMDTGNSGGDGGAGRVVGPTESGVHPGLLFGNPSPAPSAGANGKPAKETPKRVNLKVGLPGSKAPAVSTPATPLTATSHETVSRSTALNGSSSSSNASGVGSGPGTTSADADRDSSPPPAGNLDGYKEKSSDASGLLLNKPFKCPTPGCTKSYKQANGLKYHVTHGQCSFTPPPELSSLTALSALASSSLSPTSPNGLGPGSAGAGSGNGPANGRDSGASILTAATLDKLKASLSLTASQTNAPLTLITAEETLARLSAEERREVEREAERRLRPFCCAVPPCQRRYKNMNGLRYHYAHSGEHGRIGMRLLGQGKGATGTGSGSGQQSPTKENSGSAAASTNIGSVAHGGEKKKAGSSSASATPRAGTFIQQQQTPSTANGTATMPPMPPFPFPFPFPANMNWASYAQSFGISFQPQPTSQTQPQNAAANSNVTSTTPSNTTPTSTSTANGNGNGAGSGPRMGLMSTTNASSGTRAAGIVLSQPASAYASPWSSRAPSPTRSSSHSPLSNLSAQIATLHNSNANAASGQGVNGGTQIAINSNSSLSGLNGLASPVEEPPRSAYPAEDDDEMGEEEEEGEEEEGEGGEFGYPEEVEEEMIEREAARAASGVVA